MVLLVGTLDRRVIPALRFVHSVAASESRAVHVAFDAAEARQLAESWMALGATWLPLHFYEPADGRVTPAVRAAIADLTARAADEIVVTVAIPELEPTTWWHGLLHRRTARRMALALQDMPGVTAVLVPYREAASAHRDERVAVG